ncbi:MAG: purine-nucleoside phosphorylase [Bacilli bacterium]|nr:purine-nucleoside phosphorylase [Bacilli bacterium]
MKVQSNPLHINAKKDDIAELVLMPGDPLRAKYIADNFLKDVKEVTNVRNMLGFTGTYKGHRITVMGSGMGMPSMGIYAFELFYFYNVQKIVRIGTCGVVSREVQIPEIILADKVFSESNYAFQYNGSNEHLLTPSPDLVKKISEKAFELNIKVHKGAMMTSDVFGPYVDDEAQIARAPKWLNILGEEMEGFGLLLVADSFNREAAVLATAVDSPYSDKLLSVQERQSSLDNMITLALDSII